MTIPLIGLLAGLFAVTLTLGPVAGAAQETKVVVTLPPNYPPSDALMPASGALGRDNEYSSILRAAFSDAFAVSARVRYVFENPFSGTEGVLWISESLGRFQLNGLRSTRWLWKYTPSGRSQAAEFHEKLVPDDFRKVRLKRCSSEISPDLANKLIFLWRSMLRQAHRPARVELPPADGGSIYYSMTDNGQLLAGEVSPYGGREKRPRIHLFSNIGYEMRAYCESNDQAHLASIYKDAADLTRLIAVGPQRK